MPLTQKNKRLNQLFLIKMKKKIPMSIITITHKGEKKNEKKKTLNKISKRNN